MLRVLHTECRRLYRGWLTWGCLLLGWLCGWLTAGGDAPDGLSPERLMQTLLLFLAVPLLLHFGHERQCGTLRNKLTAGCTRTQIFLARMLCGWGFGVALFLPAAALFCLRTWHMLAMLPVRLLVCTAAVLLLVQLIWAAILTLCGTLIPGKGVGEIAGILLALGLVLASNGIAGALNQPEHSKDEIRRRIPVTEAEAKDAWRRGENIYQDFVRGEVRYYRNEITYVEVPNLYYVKPPLRTAYQVLDHALPGSQTLFLGNTVRSLSMMAAEGMTLSLPKERDIRLEPVWSLLMLAAVCGGGLVVFRRLEIK